MLQVLAALQVLVALPALVVLLGQAVLPGQTQVDLLQPELGQALQFLVISKESRQYKRAGAGAADMANTRRKEWRCF